MQFIDHQDIKESVISLKNKRESFSKSKRNQKYFFSKEKYFSDILIG